MSRFVKRGPVQDCFSGVSQQGEHSASSGEEEEEEEEDDDDDDDDDDNVGGGVHPNFDGDIDGFVEVVVVDGSDEEERVCFPFSVPQYSIEIVSQKFFNNSILT